ncbi:3054_t:CDS:2 [Ambispora gerdemannii]|uniref:3054_t:CDS:1 n=1 Tax=Ambispora gerdemannii TaxID=144530 RepID=A0A9N9C2B3_9GLOM|nr:3054_t:CDS:2 [Ambispora gerdemannii]
MSSSKTASSPFVSTMWLADNINSVIPVDGSWHMPASNRDPYQEYLERRIKNARSFGIDEIKDKTVDLPHMLPSPENFAKAVGDLGISENDHIVAYDSVGIFSSPRVYWTFKAFGHEKISVLDGGLPKWIEEKREIESGPVSITPKEYRTPTLNHKLVRSYQDIIKNIEQGPDTSNFEQVIDARPEKRFTGVDPEPRPGLSNGHMPYSINIPFHAVIDPSTKNTLLDNDSLKKLFESKKVDLKKPIVLSCGSGITASTLYFALEKVGARQIAVYDGSWTEYASNAKSPIVK